MSGKPKPTHGEVEAARVIVAILAITAVAWVAWSVPTFVSIVWNHTPPNHGVPFVVAMLAGLTTVLVVSVLVVAIGVGVFYLVRWLHWALTTPPAAKPASSEEL